MSHNDRKWLYVEWVTIPLSYFQLLHRQEALLEIGIPAIISTICTVIYSVAEKMGVALVKLAEILPTLLSMLIGFTVMLITILLTSNSESIEKVLKKREAKKELNGKKITLFQELHIEFCQLLIVEVLLLLLILFYFFLSGLGISVLLQFILLYIESFLTLMILLSLVRCVVNLYLSFFSQKVS